MTRIVPRFCLFFDPLDLRPWIMHPASLLASTISVHRTAPWTCVGDEKGGRGQCPHGIGPPQVGGGRDEL